MELMNGLGLGFATAFTPENLVFCFIGTVLGTLIGVLPGLGTLATVAMLLPLTFHLPPTGALIMLAGIFYGSQYGGSTTAILVNIPGESSSVVTCLDGHAMAKNGRAGAALAIAAIGSFVAGCIATLLIAVCGPFIAQVAQRFSAPEYFSLMVFGLVSAVILAHGSVFKAILMVLIGLLLGLVGTDINTGVPRFTFGLTFLDDGIPFIALATGLFGITEVIANAGARKRDQSISTVGSLRPTREEFRRAFPAMLRGSGLGSILGVLPGGGALLSSFASYTLEKKISKTPAEFGNGAVAGVAGPEAANNAGAQMSFVPMLTLGIPSNAVMALMIGAMMVHGIVPGPMVVHNQPTLFWGLIASMWLGNLMLLIINLPLIGIWVRFLSIPYRFLYPAIIVLCCVGVYSENNSGLDVMMTAIFAAFGYLLLKLRCEPAPLLLGFILGPMMEENFRRAMVLSRGDPGVFVTSPVSLVLLVCAVLLAISVAAPSIRRKRELAFTED
jgi:TctA family transporter